MAISSCALNISEGNARSSVKERRRFFQIARASVAEVGACIDLMLVFSLVSEERGKEWKEICHRISKMLYALGHR